MRRTFIAVSTITGTAIGAGFLGIPYVVSKSGFLIGMIHILLIALVIGTAMLYLGEISLRTKKRHQLAGYAEKYLGKRGKMLMLFSSFFGIYSALLAYIIAEGESISFLLFGTSQYAFYVGIIFWIIMSGITFFGLRALKKGEPIGLILVLILIISISSLFWNEINLENLYYFDFGNLFLPFGVILFSFLAFSALPEAERVLGEEKRSVKRTILIAYFMIFIVYILFTFLVLGFKGQNTPEIATLALGEPFVLLGVITMFTAYLALSIALMDTLELDFKVKGRRSWILVISAPFVLFLILNLIEKANFIKIIGIGGAISGGLAAILILLMVKKAKEMGDRKPEYSLPYSKILTFVLMLIFIAGAVFEVINFIK